MRIRRALPSDEAAIRACAEDAYGRYVEAIGRPPAPMVADFGAQIRRGHVHAATDAEGAVQGFIVFYPLRRAMHLENVAVFRSAAGQGIGRALIAVCEDEARRQGLEAVELYTNEVMASNIEMYPHLGYALTGRRIEDGFRRVFFTKALD